MKEKESGWPNVFHEDIEGWFKEGVIQADIDESTQGEVTPCPYAGALSRHWWTRGYSYQARLFRALKAERKMKLFNV